MTSPCPIIQCNIASHAVSVHYKRHARIKLLCVLDKGVYVLKNFLSWCTMPSPALGSSMASEVHRYHSYALFIKIICHSCKSSCMLAYAVDEHHRFFRVFTRVMVTCDFKVSSFKLKILIHLFLLSCVVKIYKKTKTVQNITNFD